MVKAYRDKPVKFVAVGANMSSADVLAYQQETRLAWPVYPDGLGAMQKRYGFTISLQNIIQCRSVGPDGKIVTNAWVKTKDAVDKILDRAKPEWKYRSQGFDAKLDPALDAFEWGQYVQGMKLLTPLRKSPTKAVAESANKLFDAVKKDGEGWKEEADKVAESDPVKAYDLYSKVAAVFAGDDLGKSVADPAKKLAASKPVVAELAARKSWAAFQTGITKLNAAQKPLAVKTLQDIAKKHAGTPTGDNAGTLAKELQ